jgi:hypothetical protein
MFRRLFRYALCVLVLADAAVDRVVSAEKAGRAQPFLDAVECRFDDWDGNDDGTLSVAELDAAVADTGTRGPAAAAVAALKRASRSRRYQLPALTRGSIRDLAGAKPASDRPNLPAMFAGGLAAIERADRRLFAAGKPRFETIHQGKLGNCFCLAPLAAVLGRDPRRVVQMFEPRSDGGYRVTLGTRTVDVPPVTDAELAMTAGNEQDGVWINVYEKAIGTARLLDKPPAERTGTAIDDIARGGSAGTMLSYITGHKIQRFSCKFARDEAVSSARREELLSQLRTFMAQAEREKRPMTCGTEKTTTPGLTPNHAYAILGYDAQTCRVRLWNPHGSEFKPQGPAGLEHGYPRRDGIFEMPLAEFVLAFAGLAVETDLEAGDQPELPRLPTANSDRGSTAGDRP